MAPFYLGDLALDAQAQLADALISTSLFKMVSLYRIHLTSGQSDHVFPNLTPDKSSRILIVSRFSSMGWMITLPRARRFCQPCQEG